MSPLLRMLCLIVVVFSSSFAWAATWTVNFFGHDISYPGNTFSPVSGTATVTVTVSDGIANVTFAIISCSGGNSNSCEYSGAFSGYGSSNTFGATASDTSETIPHDNWTDLIAGHIDTNNNIFGTLIVCDLYMGINAGATYLRFSSDPKFAVQGDVNNDGRIGLEEAVNALQTVSGLR